MADSTFEMDSRIRGHHVYKTVWTPVIGEILSCEREEDNLHDLFAVRARGHVHTYDVTCNHALRLIFGGLNFRDVNGDHENTEI